MAAKSRDAESVIHEPRETSPLLRGGAQHGEGCDENQDASVIRQSAEQEDDSANQHVRGGRGALIAIGLWGLIFLQGKSSIDFDNDLIDDNCSFHCSRKHVGVNNNTIKHSRRFGCFLVHDLVYINLPSM
jgi:hypothetical protein